MRITESIALAAATLDQQRTASRMVTLTRAASSGQRVNVPSDDPVSFEVAARDDGRLSVLAARSQAATRASGDLDLADGALSSASDLLVRAKEIAVEAASDSMGPSDRANAATEVNGLRDSLLALANSRGSHGYLFGGTQTQSPPFDAAGNFAGNDNPLQVEIADGVTSRANASGARAFTAAGGRDILGDLQSLAQSLSGNNVASVRASLSQLDDDHSQLIAARVDAGLSAERLRSAADVMQTATTALTTSRASEVEGDAVQTYSDLVAAQNAYQRGVDVTRQILSMTSLNRG